MDTTPARFPELEPHCGSWVATMNDKVIEIFYRPNAEAAMLNGWTVETAAQYLARINRAIKSSRP